MKTIKTTLPTGVITKQHKKESGVVSVDVELKDYDTYFDQPTLESECANNTTLLLTNMFRNLYK